MNEVIKKLNVKIDECKLKFTKKPLVIGGMAMEYYGLRKTGADIDLVICEKDYQELSKKYPDTRKDIYGDLGVVIGIFEIWRSIALLDYNFLKQGAIEFDDVLMISLDKLLLMRVCAMDVEKYKNDLIMIKELYYKLYRNYDFLAEAEKHQISYKMNNGIIFGGKYNDKKTNEHKLS